MEIVEKSTFANALTAHLYSQPRKINNKKAEALNDLPYRQLATRLNDLPNGFPPPDAPATQAAPAPPAGSMDVVHA